MVRSSGDIATLYRRTVAIAGHGTEARALYFPGANLVVIPYYSRTILGHELALLSDRSLSEVDTAPSVGADRAQCRGRPAPSAPVARRAPAPSGLAVRAMTGPLADQAN